MIISACIPARLASTRLPRKVLADINGKPLLWHVWNQVMKVSGLYQVYIATDSDEVRTQVESWGGKVLMTSPTCRSGTERVASTLDCIDGDLIFNVQGDEPLIDPQILELMVEVWKQKGGDIITPVYKITEVTDLFNPNVVKVVRGLDGQVMYFSRSPVPFVRDLETERWLEQGNFWAHVGVYGYTRKALADYLRLPVSPLESVEKLEQLRFLDAGYVIQSVETDYHPISVDTRADLERVRQILSE